MPKQLHCRHVDYCYNIQSGFMHNLETTVHAQSAATSYCTSTYIRKGYHQHNTRIQQVFLKA